VSEGRVDDNALMAPGQDATIRLLLHMKYGPHVHGLACNDPAFRARHEAAIDAAVDALLKVAGTTADGTSYTATTRHGESATFGDRAAAVAWAGPYGEVTPE
jgi:hypothetical protein